MMQINHIDRLIAYFYINVLVVANAKGLIKVPCRFFFLQSIAIVFIVTHFSVSTCQSLLHPVPERHIHKHRVVLKESAACNGSCGIARSTQIRHHITKIELHGQFLKHLILLCRFVLNTNHASLTDDRHYLCAQAQRNGS